ncbi:MAG: ORF6N domain-containing protein [Bacteroidales bacterium]|nr:ORF6N domain-containing protein [Bacteroidales bacterium]
MPDNSLQTINIENKILMIRGQQVMLDRDLAELYGVETKRLNEQVKRNIERFPEDFMFQLTRNELELVKSQIATSPNNLFAGQEGGTRKLPYAFTEHGVTMLSAVLKSETAIKASIQIVKAFVAMRHFVQNNAQIFAELKSMRQHQIETDVQLNETNRRIDELFDRMDKYAIDDTQGIFFQGQIFDAYAKFESFLQSATKEIVLIDNYVDLSVLQRLAKKQQGVNVTIFTKANTPLSAQDIQTFNAQYPTLTVRHTTTMHDRFLIIDNATLYHIGASLKDLGKKCFAFEILDSSLIAAVKGNL